MNTYIVKYLDGTDLKVAFTQGVNQKEAEEEFKKAFPDIGSEKIIDVINIDSMQKNYGTTIAISKFISFIGWIILLWGIFKLISFVGMFSAIDTITSGLMLIIAGQLTRATAEMANNVQSILDEIIYKNSK